MCGKCCTGTGEVWVTEDEASTIAASLKISQDLFLRQYAQKYFRYKDWYLLRNKGNKTKDCVFLSADGKTCTIHDVRPKQCSTYPWWPELVDREDWEWEKGNICEGFDHPEAEPVDLRAAAEQLREANIHNQMRMLAQVPKSSQRGQKQEDAL